MNDRDENQKLVRNHLLNEFDKEYRQATAEEQKSLRSYLLGELNEQEREEVEERLLTDDDFFKESLLMEGELIDDYVKGELSADDRKKFEATILRTPSGRQQVATVRALRDYVDDDPVPVPPLGPSWWQRLFASPTLKLAASFVVLLLMSLGVWRLFFHQSGVDKGLAALKKAYISQRPFEARITEFDYAQYSVTRGKEPESTDDLSLRRVENLLIEEKQDHPNAKSFYGLGKFYLATGKFDNAIHYLEQAVAIEPANDLFHSDLGTAYFERGKEISANNDSGKQLEDFDTSLLHFTKAIELNPNNMTALFNRALLRQTANSLQAAKEDWLLYLAKDSTSPWAVEARKKLQEVEKQLNKLSQSKEQVLQEFLQAYREKNEKLAWEIISSSRDFLSGKAIYDQLLNSYLQLSLAGQLQESEQKVTELTFVGRLENLRANDRQVSDLISFYQTTTLDSRNKLSAARNLMASGHKSYLDSDQAKAIHYYQQAKEIFTSTQDSVEGLIADYWIALCTLEAINVEQGLNAIEELIPTLEQKNYKWLLLRALYTLSNAEYNSNNYSKAIAGVNRSLYLAQQSQDTIGMVNALNFLAECYRSVGNFPDSLGCLQRSIAFVQVSILNPLQIWRNYEISASAFYASGLYHLAFDIQKEALASALLQADAANSCISYAHLGLNFGKQENFNEAFQQTQLAYNEASKITDQTYQKSLVAYLDLQVGHLYKQKGDYNKAIDSYNKCIAEFNGINFNANIYQAYKGRLFCLIKTHDDAAKEEIVTTLDLVEKYRSKIHEENNRNHFFDIEQNVYDLAIDFEALTLNNNEKAFDYLEASKARSLLDILLSKAKLYKQNKLSDWKFDSVTKPLSLQAIKQRLPQQSQILQYSILEDKLIAWVISGEGQSNAVETVDISEKDLSEKVHAYLKVITNKQEDFSLGKDLFDLLIKPVEPYLDKNKTLCIVPDKILYYLPFESLVSSITDNYLLKDLKINYTPSSSLFIYYSEAAKAKEEEVNEKFLGVGNPSFDREAFPNLKNLRSAETEVRGIAQYYSFPLPQILIGSDATKEKVKAELQKADVIHLALHSIINDFSPMYSGLVLAKNSPMELSQTEQKSILQAQEIYDLKLPKTRLVVLSACQTGIDKYYNGEGMLNITRPFLVAGVPIIIASLWAVDSDDTKELMISFHKYRKQNKSSIEALQLAQSEMLQSDDQRLRKPFCWASFVAIGGYTNF